MPNYVTITPKYQVVDLAEMLKVPELLTKETNEANKELEEYKDKISKYRALLGDNADKYFGNYNDLMDTLASNPTIADRQEVARQLRDRFRDVSAKAELAAPALQKWSDYFAKNPHLVGNPGTIDTYMQNPNFTPVISDSKALQEDLENLLIRDLTQQAPKAIGHMEGDPSTLVVRQGRTNEEVAGIINNTIDALRRGEEPTDVLSKDMYNAALKQGYNNQDEAGKRRLEQSLWKAAPAGFAKTSTKADPNYLDAAARLNYQIAQEKLRALRESNRQEAKLKSIPKGYNKTTFDDDAGNTYAWKEDNKGNLHLQKYNEENGKWEPVPYKDKDGKATVIYKDGIPITGVTDNKGNSYFKYSGNGSGSLGVDYNTPYSRWIINLDNNDNVTLTPSRNSATHINDKRYKSWVFNGTGMDVDDMLNSKDFGNRPVMILQDGNWETLNPSKKDKDKDKLKSYIGKLENKARYLRSTDKKNSNILITASISSDGKVFIDAYTNGIGTDDQGLPIVETPENSEQMPTNSLDE